MFCGKCGSQINEGSKFCHVCGAPAQQGAPVAAPVTNHVQRKAPAPKKQPNKKLIAAGAVALVVVLVVVLVISLFGGPSAKVTKALVKSGKEFYAVAEELKLTELGELLKNKKSSQTLSMQMNGIPELDGIGFRMTVDGDLSGKKIGASVTPFMGSADLLNLQMKLDDSKIYFGSPEITDGTYYMIDTKTVGQDLNELAEELGGSGIEELEDLSFNIFELLEQIEKINKDNEKLTKEVKKAFADFAKTIEVEKGKKETVEVNGNDLKCTGYEVVLTEDAMKDLVKALEEIYKDADKTDAYLEVVESVGLPEDVMEEMESAMKGTDMGDTFDELYDAVKEIGDIELDVYLNGGYIVAAVYEKDEGTMTLNIGGGKNYVDDISLRIEEGDFEGVITSSGNHACAGGKFTDVTEVTESYSNRDETLMTMELEYDLKGKDENFSLTLEADGEKLEASGHVSFGKDAVVLDMEEISVPGGAELGLEYRLEKYAGDKIKVKNAVELMKMSEDDLTEEAEKMMENAEDLLSDLMDEYPELAYLF